MKIIKIILSTTTIISLLAFNVNYTHSAKHHKGQTVTIDGVQVSYDPNAINGGIDLTTEKEKLVAITTNYTLESKEIYVPFEQQINEYYFGTATASMLTKSINIPQTQQQISNLLEEPSAVTAGKNLSTALNRLLENSKFRFYWEWHNNVNDITTMKTHIVSAIEYGNPVMVNMTEGPGDNYLRGHNIGYSHSIFGLISGFYNYGDRIKYIEPGYGRFSGFVKPQVTTIENLSYATGDRGYVW